MATIDLSSMTLQERKELADKIYEQLGRETQINLGVELTLHYKRCNDAAELAYKALEDGNATAGSAAVLTAATGAIKELARLQIDLYNAERVKVLEKAFQNVLRQSDNAEYLLTLLEEELERAGE